jgi:catalase
MPLPTDEKLVALSNDLIAQFDAIFGEHSGFRPAHAKGVMLKGVFTPYVAAGGLTRAPHMLQASTPVTVRFSNSTGLPLVPDNDPNANPRGMAVRFHLGEHSHTDIVSHSTDGFPTRTGAEFLEFLKALASSDLAAPPDPAHPKPIEVYLGSHPAALKFVQTPKPAPSSFAREAYYGVTAMAFLNQQGLRQFGRYQILPELGTEHLDDATVATKDGNYLFDELKTRVAAGPIRFRVAAQLANPGEVVDDATNHWAANSRVVDLGTLSLTALVTEEGPEQKKIIFDPIPRVDGIEPSNDPLLELRAAVYLISGRRRRSAE